MLVGSNFGVKKVDKSKKTCGKDTQRLLKFAQRPFRGKKHIWTHDTKV